MSGGNVPAWVLQTGVAGPAYGRNEAGALAEKNSQSAPDGFNLEGGAPSRPPNLPAR
jgi:hypothetical protein